MAHQLVSRDDAMLVKLRALRESREFFQLNVNQWQKTNKHYLVLHRHDIVSEGMTVDEAWSKAGKASVPIGECLLAHVPQKGESYFF